MRLRTPAELSAREIAWFQPGLDRLAALGGDSDAVVREFFSGAGPLYLARAPGRLDVMGGIADYSGSQVLELPLDRATQVLVQRQGASRCDFASRRSGRWEHFSLDLAPLLIGADASPDRLREWFASSSDGRWASYLAGIVRDCLRDTDPAASSLPGFRLMVDSAVPEGKGVASSAALEVAAMAAVAAACGIALTPPELATRCQWVENHIVGAPCGIMDQMTSACGVTDRLLQLRCQPGLIEGHLLVPAGYRFFGIDSGIRHAVTGADYGTVRTAAFMGYRILADALGLAWTFAGPQVQVDDPVWRGCLANIPLADFTSRFEQLLPRKMTGTDFLARFGGITDSVTRVSPGRSYPVRSAAAHPIGEQHRVTRFIELLGRLDRAPEAAVELGALMYASHRSYGACGLGSEGTDRLVALVAAAGPERGLFGAKITGGGSGGTVAVFGREEAQPEVEAIAIRYAGDTRGAEVFTGSGPGAAETGVLVLPPLPLDRSRGLPHTIAS